MLFYQGSLRYVKTFMVWFKIGIFLNFFYTVVHIGHYHVENFKEFDMLHIKLQRNMHVELISC